MEREMFENGRVLIPAGYYHIFGSGGANAELWIDAERVRGTVDMGADSFGGYLAAENVVARLLVSRNVRYHTWSYPGGEWSYAGTGRGLLSRLFRRGTASRDPAADPMVWQHGMSARRLRAKREAEAAEAAMSEAIRKLHACGWEFRLEGGERYGAFYSRQWERVRLPDGAAGRRPTPWRYMEGATPKALRDALGG